jgi:hypothetical protein
VADAPLRNADVDWDSWPVQEYLAENYRILHPSDLAVIEHHSAFFATLRPDSIASSVELGAGPNLYPLMLAAGVSRDIHAVEPSAASVGYLTRQLREGPDPTWEPFWAACVQRQPALPASLSAALARVRLTHAPIASVAPGGYDLASMHFVAESVTEDRAEFQALCAAFVAAVRPGGLLVAAFMENMGRYRLGDGSAWPGYPVDTTKVRAAFAPYTDRLELERIDADATLPDYGYTGMVLLTGRRTVTEDPDQALNCLM